MLISIQRHVFIGDGTNSDMCCHMHEEVNALTMRAVLSASLCSTLMMSLRITPTNQWIVVFLSKATGSDVVDPAAAGLRTDGRALGAPCSVVVYTRCYDL